jgi:hypothetical protein
VWECEDGAYVVDSGMEELDVFVVEEEEVR